MGMFDYISQVPVQNCRKCGQQLGADWQSKDGPCELLELPFWQVRNFYQKCHNKVGNKECGEWHEYILREPLLPRPLADYDLLPQRSVTAYTADGETK